MSQTAQAEGLSEKARTMIEQMLNSGDSQQVAVAEALDTIACNGDGQETDEFLAGCAQEIAAEAAYASKHLKPREQPLGPPDVETTIDILGLADVTVTATDIEHFTPEMRQAAVDWAGSVHLSASDNDDVVVPPCPHYVPPSDTETRLAESNKDSVTWAVVADGQTIGSVALPSYAGEGQARRFAYQKYRFQIGSKEWKVKATPSST